MSTLTRFLLWDPDTLKLIFRGLYKRMEKELGYIPNDDGVYPSPPLKCQSTNCPEESEGCWDDFESYLKKFKLDDGVLKQFISEELDRYTECPKDLLTNYRYEEIIQEIEYRRNVSSPVPYHPLWGPVVLKITDQEHEQLLSNTYPSAWEGTDVSHTVILLTDHKAPSSIMTDAIRKAYGIGRMAIEPERLFEPRFVASCLITATMPIHAGNNFWYPINKKPYDVEYSYLLTLNYPKRKWHIEGQRLDHGIFVLGQWRIEPLFFPRKTLKKRNVRCLYMIFIGSSVIVSPVQSNR